MDNVQLDTPGTLIAAAATGTAAVIVFALLPVISGKLADQFQLDAVQTGLVASSYFSVYALIALTSMGWIRRFDWIITARVGYATMLAGLSLSLLAPSFALSSAGLAVVGAGAGLLFPISLTLVSDMQHTDRGYAIKLSVEQLVPAAVLFMLASQVFSGFGLATTLLAVIAVVVVCFLCSGRLPARGNQHKHTDRHGQGNALLGVASLVALAVGFAGFAGLWAFFERIATESRLDASFTTTWLAVGLITSGLGPVGAALLEDRYGRSLPIISATALALATLMLLANDTSKLAYATVLTLLPLSYYFSVAYVFSVVAEADHNGRMAGLMSFALAVGAGSGPVLFGLVKANNGPAMLSMALLLVAGAGMITWIHRQLVQTNRNTQHD